MNFQDLNKQRKFILIAAAVGIISIFLPWITIGTGKLFGESGLSSSINGFHGVGVFVFLLFIAIAILALIGQQKQALEKTMWILTIAAGAIALLSVGIRMLNNDVSGGFGIVQTSYGIGIWLCLLASLAVIAFAWMYKNPGDTLKSGFESLKKDLPTQGTSAPKTSRIDELERLIELKTQGKISEEEYQNLKSKIV